MKRFMVYLCLFGLVIRPQYAKAILAASTSEYSPKVLIISSYQCRSDWSKHIIDKVTAKLTGQYPDINIHVGYMNLDLYTLPSNPMFTLRSILWSYADKEPTAVTAEDMGFKTMFSSEKCPDVILFIGDDALLFYQRYSLWLGQWRSIPLVVCGASDYIIDGEYSPGASVDFDTLIPIEERRTVDAFVSSQNIESLDDEFALRKYEKDGLKGYMVSVDYNLTGVKNTIPVQENLKLIHHLIPDLSEIVWVDNDFYSSDYARWLIRKELFAIFPDIKFGKIRQNRFNTDSIYNEILKPVSNKAYLTYSWNVNGIYSRQTDGQIRTLFANYSNTPLFSLTRRLSSNPYWIGGYYRSDEELTDKTVKQIVRILQGEEANKIPFETVTGGRIALDQSLLNKYGLLKYAKTLKSVEFVNVPPTFFEENEEMILAGSIIGVIILGLLLHWLRRYRYTHKLHLEYVRYKKLYNKLHLIYEHTSIDLALYDKNGKLIFNITKGREYYAGGDKTEAFSGNIFEDPNLNSRLKEQIKNNQPINTEITVDTDGPLSALDSERKIYQLIVKPLNETDVWLAKYVAIAINLNPVVREREERERFETLVRFASDSSQVGIAFYDIDTAVGTATNSWYQNLNEPLGPGKLPAYGSVVTEDRAALMEFRRKVQSNEEVSSFSRDIRVCDKSGDMHWIIQHIFVNENNPRMLIELNLNIDEQKNKEADLRAAKEKVEQSILATQEFLANINHEIRTPLNSIVGFSAILAASENDEERKEYVALILKNNKLLTMLIDDVIELSKIDAGQAVFVREPVKVDELFKKVMDTGHSELYNKDLTIVEELDHEHPIVYGDSNALYRLLTNLMSNAIKFTQEGSATLGYRKEKGRYYFFVKDTGKGIAPGDQKRIFKRFEKLDSYMQGTGLGLAVCKSLVESLGGEIGIVSEIGKGSTFWFTLPIE